MCRSVPLDDGFTVHMAHLCPDILSKQCLGADEIQLSQRVEHAGQVIEVRTYLVGHSGEDTDDFASYLGLGFTDAVVSLDNGIRLNKHGLARSTLVMNDTMEFALVHGTHGEHQAPVAQRGLYIGLKNSLLLAL